MSKYRKFIQRRRAALFELQHGDCYWCHKPMVMLEVYPRGPVGPTVCTLDHLFDRADPRRRVHKNGQSSYVAACWQCNHDRGRATAIRISSAKPPLIHAEAAE